jgi:hypothetical protein
MELVETLCIDHNFFHEKYCKPICEKLTSCCTYVYASVSVFCNSIKRVDDSVRVALYCV